MRNCLHFVCVGNSCPLTFDLNSQKSGLSGSRCKGEVHTQPVLRVNRVNELSGGFKSQLCYLWECTDLQLSFEFVLISSIRGIFD